MKRILHITPALQFSWRQCLDRAAEILMASPVRTHTRRVPPRGELVCRFALPLDLCKTTNFTRHAQAWNQGRDKALIRQMLWTQYLSAGHDRRQAPLPGRPQVRCVRFSARATDPYADWAKAAVDALTAKRGGLGLLVDDDEDHCDLWQWSEHAGRGQGFVYIEVREGKTK